MSRVGSSLAKGASTTSFQRDVLSARLVGDHGEHSGVPILLVFEPNFPLYQWKAALLE